MVMSSDGPNRRDSAEWFDDDAGPLIRHFAVTRGRTHASRSDFAMVAVVQTVSPEPHVDPLHWGPEHREILRLCRRAKVVADLGSDLDLPLSVLHVLLGDLLDNGLIALHEPFTPGERPSPKILRDVLHGLEAL